MAATQQIFKAWWRGEIHTWPLQQLPTDIAVHLHLSWDNSTVRNRCPTSNSVKPTCLKWLPQWDAFTCLSDRLLHPLSKTQCLIRLQKWTNLWTQAGLQAEWLLAWLIINRSVMGSKISMMTRTYHAWLQCTPSVSNQGAESMHALIWAVYILRNAEPVPLIQAVTGYCRSKISSQVRGKSKRSHMRLVSPLMRWMGQIYQASWASADLWSCKSVLNMHHTNAALACRLAAVQQSLLKHLPSN